MRRCIKHHSKTPETLYEICKQKNRKHRDIYRSVARIYHRMDEHGRIHHHSCGRFGS